MASSNHRILTVQHVTQVTPNMRRITFGGAGLADFPEGHEGGYIKLVFPDEPRSNPDRPVMRTYTILAHDVENATVTVDFALHGDSGGIATDWAISAQPGDCIPIAGPGSVKLAAPGRDWYLLAGDMTAFPALMCNFQNLPEDASGYVVIEIISDADKRDLNLPAGMELQWVVNPTPDVTKGALVDQIMTLPWRDGDVFVWTACEFDSMRRLRSYYRTERGVERDQFYLSSYWRAGRTEDQHKVDKSKDNQADKAALAGAG
ncbi:siderophore-interacting protein [Halocynthiibacter sp.]|uniref:siderophore-interacting protein n=1 Tax=Halocynthiibacter sp. TaxID=1979210 RepID=UPI003C3AD2B1